MIQLAQINDIPRLLEIYAAAKQFMHTHGNPTQWSGSYPDREDLILDIRKKQLYCLVSSDTGRIHACFMLTSGPDPTYTVITGGSWRSDSPYGVIHRVASDGSRRCVLAQCVEFARQQYTHLRIDTHENNIPMQRALAKEGFIHRGTIITDDGTPRLAYDWLRD